MFLAALSSPAGKGLTALLSCVLNFLMFVTFQCGVPGQVWYLSVLIPDRCLPLSVNRTIRVRLATSI